MTIRTVASFYASGLFLLFCLENEKNNLEKENRLCEWGSHLALSAFHLVPRSECSYSTVTIFQAVRGGRASRSRQLRQRIRQARRHSRCH